VFDVRTHTDGGQTAEAVGDRVAAWLAEARETLDLALYDVRLPGAVGDRVANAIRAAAARGVRVRIAYNQDERPDEDGERPFFPAPPRTEPHVLETLGVPVKPIPGWRDLMHHKYVVRDGGALWTGSMNWTLDSFTRHENAIATLESPRVAAAFTRNFEQLWERGRVGDSGDFDAAAADGIRPWFCPGRGPELSHRIAKRIGAARRRVRIATPLLTAGPILGTLAEVVEERRVDVAGVCDATQVAQGVPAVGGEPAVALEGAAAGALPRRLPRQALDAVRAGGGPRLHARQGDGRRRRRVPRLVQPVAVGRGERRERAGDRRRAAGRPPGRLDRRAAGALSGGRLAHGRVDPDPAVNR
jgi:phosphatidylserine/phosphatidylglycerophosphate/cardiolipin synthase-like enzyme